ncbi:unnamed protein product, partial [Allacma fusca]
TNCSVLLCITVTYLIFIVHPEARVLILGQIELWLLYLLVVFQQLK